MRAIIGAVGSPVKRPYRSERRAAAAAATRQRIREAATDLFVAQGFAATSLREVAQRAGVGERTVYDAFPNKVALFHHVLDVATVGDELDVAVADRQEIHDSNDETDPLRAVRLYLDYSIGLLERAGALIMVMYAAADADPEMRAITDAGATATHQLHLRFAQTLDQRGSLAAGIDPDEASDVLYALTSPHLHQLLRRDRGWSVDQYRAWLERTVTREIFDTDPSSPPT